MGISDVLRRPLFFFYLMTKTILFIAVAVLIVGTIGVQPAFAGVDPFQQIIDAINVLQNAITQIGQALNAEIQARNTMDAQLQSAIEQNGEGIETFRAGDDILSNGTITNVGQGNLHSSKVPAAWVVPIDTNVTSMYASQSNSNLETSTTYSLKNFSNDSVLLTCTTPPGILSCNSEGEIAVNAGNLLYIEAENLCTVGDCRPTQHIRVSVGFN